MTEELDPILSSLNPEQREAVLHEFGPLLIFAGAGSGKTRVLTHRIAWLVARRGVPPHRILAVTFTNKAAGEMRERVERLLPGQGKAVWVSTFHSACAQILRTRGERIGIARGFSIYDDTDQRALVKDLLRRREIDPKLIDPRVILSQFDRAKNDLVDPEKMAGHLLGPMRDIYLKIARDYREELKKNNALDFGDLIVRTVELLRDVPEVREIYRKRFLHILVDEFQDTNTAQARLLELLLDEHNNLCVVGDDDQSIYRWRGANIENILGFDRVFPNAVKVVLGRNYRSTSNILAVADAVIRHNRGRVAKELSTTNDAGRKVQLFRADDEYDEARFVAAGIRETVERQGLPRRDIAIFYRINALSRVFEEELLRSNIPFVVVGGTRFYDRKEIKDILAYLRLVVNPTDDVAAMRVINVPARKIGKTTVETIEQAALAGGLSFLAASERMAKENELPRGASAAVDGFLHILREIAEDAGKLPLPGVLESALKRSGYLAMLEQDRSVESLSRKENLGELYEAVSQFHKRNPDATLSDYLEQVSLTQDADLVKDEEDTVRLMTLHNAKGLEFPCVFMVGLEESILPHIRSINEGDREVEEERRLCYVGITRAKRFLTLSCAARRRSYSGLPAFSRASRFLDEIPPELTQSVGFAALRPAFRFPDREMGRIDIDVNPPRQSFLDNVTSIRNSRTRVPPRESSVNRGGGKPKTHEGEPGETYYDYSEAESEGAHGGLTPGRRVMHQKFGAGFVMAVAGSGDRARVTVRFASVGVKTMLVQYANLELL